MARTKYSLARSLQEQILPWQRALQNLMERKWLTSLRISVVSLQEIGNRFPTVFSEALGSSKEEAVSCISLRASCSSSLFEG